MNSCHVPESFSLLKPNAIRCLENRYEFIEENGKQTLVVKDLKLSDTAEISCKIGDRETSAKLQVEEGIGMF